MKASAGAGKTYRLTREYIRLLLEGDESSYKHILAVTFTNKATEEMKSRIIEELHKMAKDTSLGDKSVKARSRLTKILNDYSCFSVTTIDKFFQGVMRSFAREIGQYASYKVELDTDAVVSGTVDLLLDSLDNPSNKDLLEWLKVYSLRQIEDGASWNMTKPLSDISKLFFKEDFKILMKNSPGIIENRDAIKDLDAKVRGIKKDFESEARRIGKEALRVMSENGLAPEDFKGKSRGPFIVFKKLAAGLPTVPSPKLRESFAGHEIAELQTLVEEVLTVFENRYSQYVSAKLIHQNLYLLGIYSDLYKQLESYLKENNVVLLSESTDLLGRIIDGNDTPFIYEKTGVRFEHIMLDESQDTSRLQWKNFVPLFRENIGSGNENLVVGDIKQSIYRWRGSDWRLMSDYIFDDLGSRNILEETLQENWRSCRSIVGFNNNLFLKAGDCLALEEAEIGRQVGQIYGDCRQTVPDAHSGWPEGRVKVGFLDKADWKHNALERMYADIKELLAAGYRYEDITVLVRRNAEGADVASYLMGKSIGVITEDSLLIEASDIVSRLLEILRRKADPADAVCGIMLEGCLDKVDSSDIKGSLYDVCEAWLRDGDLFEIKSGDVPFVNAFMDCVVSYQDKYGSSLRGFLKWWDESGHKKSICAPEGRDAVRIMTIHKSKGLGLEAVIIPFMEEKFAGIPDTIWCNATGEFSDVGIIPMKAAGEMEDSLFKDRYLEERLYSHIDSVNTAYVALTRPVSQLVIYAPKPSKPNDFKITSFANLMFSVLKDSLDESGAYVVGSIGGFTPKKQSVASDSLRMDGFFSAPIEGRLTLALGGDSFFEEGNKSARRRGIELHEILSRVDRAEDLREACRDDDESYGLLKPHLDEVASRHWFDGTYISLKESSIVSGDGEVQRPDRILIDESSSKAIIIDYKFGERRGHYKKQVQHYASLLREMGYRDVESYLWYVLEDNVEKMQ